MFQVYYQVYSLKIRENFRNPKIAESAKGIPEKINKILLLKLQKKGVECFERIFTTTMHKWFPLNLFTILEKKSVV